MLEILKEGCAVWRRRQLVLALSCLPALFLAGCTPRQPYPLPEPSQIPFGEGRLWQVDGDGSTPSYVFGTIRIGDDRVLDLPAPVNLAFTKAETVALESSVERTLASLFANVERLKFADDESLEDLLGARSFGILRRHMKRSELRPKDNIKPWAFWVYMGGTNWGFIDYHSSFSESYGTRIDSWLRNEARVQGKKVAGLETGQEYFDFFDKIPLEQQVDLLKVRLDRYHKTRPDVPKAQLYLDGDLAMQDAIWREYLSWLEPATAETLDTRRIVNRNRVMVERLIPLMEENPTFVAVDVLHLPGEKGILRLLEQEGYTVTRLH